MAEWRAGRQPRHVVDFHTHAFPEKVAARAVAALTATYHVSPVAEPTIPGLLDHMDRSGVDVSVVAPVATRADQVRSINTWAAEAGNAGVVCFGALHPELEDPAAEVERIISLGLKGVKCQPNFQRFAPDDPRMLPAYEAAQGRLVMLFHSGQEIAPLERVWAQPEALGRVHQVFPRLAMVVAHFGGYLMWEQARRHLIGREVYLDISYCAPGGLGEAEMRDQIRAHGVERVLFGSDFPWGDPGEELARLCRLGLEVEELEAVAWRNAQRLLGLAMA